MAQSLPSKGFLWRRKQVNKQLCVGGKMVVSQTEVVKHVDANNQHVKEASSKHYVLVILIKAYGLAEM